MQRYSWVILKFDFLSPGLVSFRFLPVHFRAIPFKAVSAGLTIKATELCLID